jgi:hypothetical protein
VSANQIFISYSHKDRVWLDRVKTSLKPYLREEGIKAWSDNEIQVASNWQEQIMNAMASSKIAVLLVSSDFLASDFIYNHELPYLFQAAKEKRITIIPIAVRPAAWEADQRLEELQWANEPRMPLAGLRPVKREAELVKISKLISDFFPADALPPQEIPPEAPDIVEAVSHSAEEGLKALLALMNNTDVKSKVATFERDFANTSEKIELLGYYKDLHDALHELQFSCYNYLMGIIRSAKRNPDDPAIWDAMVSSELNLREKIVSKLERVGERNPLVHSRQDWIPKLLHDLEALFDAISQYDVEVIEKAIRPIRMVLAQRPVPINGSLTAAAEALQLDSLVTALTDVRECLGGAQLNPERVKKFAIGINALNGLEVSLDALKDSHNEWQEIDVLLRLVDGTIAINYSQLEIFWPDLKEKTTEQCAGFAEPWASRLMQDMARLDEALNNSDDMRIRQHFQSFMTRASYRFYEVDKALKELCEQLRKVGEPLTQVWEMIK